MNVRNTCVAPLIALLMLTSPFAAFAVIPESGLWWNPQEPGRGYGIEMQNDDVFVTYYAYQPDGQKSAFYTSFGKLDSRTGVMTGYWAAAENGQCFGCPHREPQLSNLGQARLEFTSPTTGRIVLPGNTPIPIERQIFVGQHRHDPKALLGVWTIVDGSTLFFGEAVWFRATTDAVENGFSGHRVGSTQRVLLGRPTNNSNLPPILVLLDSSTSYYTAYAFDNSLNRWIGRSWTYPKTGQLSGPGLPSVAHRLMGNAHAQQSATTGISLKVGSSDQETASLERSNLNRSELGSIIHSETSPGKIQIGEDWFDTHLLQAAIRELEASFHEGN